MLINVSTKNDLKHNSDDNSTKASASKLLDITFDDIDLPIQEDMVVRPFMFSDSVKELEGKRIRISGVMLPDSKRRGIKEFVLLKNRECKFGPGGAADHLINVILQDDDTTYYRDDEIEVEGTFSIVPYNGPDGNTWKIYDLACERVAKFRKRR